MASAVGTPSTPSPPLLLVSCILPSWSLSLLSRPYFWHLQSVTLCQRHVHFKTLITLTFKPQLLSLSLCSLFFVHSILIYQQWQCQFLRTVLRFFLVMSPFMMKLLSVVRYLVIRQCTGYVWAPPPSSLL